MLYIRDYNYLFFNDQEQRIEQSFAFDDIARAYGSCFTMLNGEAVIFGGLWDQIERQVTNSSSYCLISVNFLDFGCLWMFIETTW